MPYWLIALTIAPALLVLPPFSAPAAHADEIAGTILSIDPFTGRFSLADGSQFVLPADDGPEDLMIGMSVLVIYTTTETGDLLVTGLKIRS
ncbi:DUF1344 domain-containing protein [Roseibium sp. M-1]